MSKKQFKQVCECKNCGNEAEMQITCSLEPEDETPATSSADPKTMQKKRIKGQAVCSHCGNEADMWIDLEDSQI